MSSSLMSSMFVLTPLAPASGERGSSKAAPHPQPLAPAYRGEGGKVLLLLLAAEHLRCERVAAAAVVGDHQRVAADHDVILLEVAAGDLRAGAVAQAQLH